MKEINHSIYLDNASTSYPKSDVVLKGIENYALNIGISPHRSTGYYGKKAEKVVFETRAALARLLNIKNPDHISFTHNATHALNILIKGILKEGDHVILSNFEHNAVLRPLQKMKDERGVTFDVIQSNIEGIFDLSKIEQKINPRTKLIIWNHASNVLGVVSPIEAISQLAKKYNLLLLVDCAQTAGIIDIDVQKNQIDFLAGTGHKCLLGPPGVGFLYVKDCSLVKTLLEGGSGHNSASLYQPEDMPHKFEAGTLNYLGIAGFFHALEYLASRQEEIKYHEFMLLEYLINQLQNVEGIKIYGTLELKKKVPLVSFNMKGLFPQELSFLLENEFSIIARGGLHCAPNIHKTLHTFPTGALRVSLGYKTTKTEIETLISALVTIQKKIHSKIKDSTQLHTVMGDKL